MKYSSLFYTLRYRWVSWIFPGQMVCLYCSSLFRDTRVATTKQVSAEGCWSRSALCSAQAEESILHPDFYPGREWFPFQFSTGVWADLVHGGVREAAGKGRQRRGKRGRGAPCSRSAKLLAQLCSRIAAGLISWGRSNYCSLLLGPELCPAISQPCTVWSPSHEPVVELSWHLLNSQVPQPAFCGLDTEV